MAHPNVIAAVRSRLAAGFDRCAVYEEGTYSPSASLDPFLVVQYPFSRSRQATAGDPENNVYREEGGIRFVMFVRRKGGVADGRQWCEEIATLFRGKSFEGVRTWAPGSPATDDANDRDGFFVLAFVVPYEFDLNG